MPNPEVFSDRKSSSIMTIGNLNFMSVNLYSCCPAWAGNPLERTDRSVPELATRDVMEGAPELYTLRGPHSNQEPLMRYSQTGLMLCWRRQHLFARPCERVKDFNDRSRSHHHHFRRRNEGSAPILCLRQAGLRRHRILPLLPEAPVWLCQGPGRTVRTELISDDPA